MLNRTISTINRRALGLLNGLITFKESILQAVGNGALFTANYPLLIRHIIREAGATFHNIRNGKKLNFGARAVIKRRDGTSFREFALFVHDFALLFDRDGKALNPPEVPGTHDNPATPILETYPGDELMIRLLDGAHEEQHSFILTGMTWKKEIDDAWLGLWGTKGHYHQARI